MTNLRKKIEEILYEHFGVIEGISEVTDKILQVIENKIANQYKLFNPINKEIEKYAQGYNAAINQCLAKIREIIDEK